MVPAIILLIGGDEVTELNLNLLEEDKDGWALAFHTTE